MVANIKFDRARWFTMGVVLLLTSLYAAGRVSPAAWPALWWTGFIIPAALACNVVLLIVSIFRDRITSVLLIIPLLVGWSYVRRTVPSSRTNVAATFSTRRFSIVSFNISAMQTLYGEFLAGQRPNIKARQTRDWMLQTEGDILCFQEFLSLSGHAEFDLIQQLKAMGYNVHFSGDSSSGDHSVGLLIASRFPIVHAGDIPMRQSPFQFNRLCYADVLIGSDTLRVINFHLASMALKPHNPLQSSDVTTASEQAAIILRRLRKGAVVRASQSEDLVTFVRRSPYEVICAGDLNDIPYTYTYDNLRRVLRNSFEDAGRGLGFTYNGALLRVLRIDNQFYSTGITALSFETFRHVTSSDHFPVEGHYVFHH